MSQQKITKLTPEQEALIPVYREKWRAIALSIEATNHQKFTEAVDSAYIAIGLYLPHILFFNSPYEGLGKLEQRLVSQSKRGLYTLLYKPWESRCKNSDWLRYKLNPLNRLMSLGEELQKQLDNKLYTQLKHQLEDRLQNQLQNLLDESSQLYRQMELALYGWDYIETLEMVNSRDVQVFPEYSPLGQLFQDTIQPELWACTGSLYDFCISVLNCHHDEKKWQAFQLLVKNCGCLLGFEKICLVCVSEAPPKEVRPTNLSFDNENRLHAEGEPAIFFGDGYSLYSYYGVTLPEKYGKLHPNQWQSKWLL